MSITPIGGIGGTSETMATLMSFEFYTKSANWFSNIPWDIDNVPNSNKIWMICEGLTLPFFQWQGLNCSK